MSTDVAPSATKNSKKIYSPKQSKWYKNWKKQHIYDQHSISSDGNGI